MAGGCRGAAITPNDSIPGRRLILGAGRGIRRDFHGVGVFVLSGAGAKALGFEGEAPSASGDSLANSTGGGAGGLVGELDERGGVVTFSKKR